MATFVVLASFTEQGIRNVKETINRAEAFKDISHLLRPGHLKQLRGILDDNEASPNDKYVALELLKNANIAAGGVLDWEVRLDRVRHDELGF